MVVEDGGAVLDGSQSLKLLRSPFVQEMQLDDQLVDLTRCIHLGKVHLVALVQGAPTRDRLNEQLKEHDRYRLFSTQLLRPISVRRLPEFRRHLPEGKTLNPPSWQEQVALVQQDYAWNRAEGYTPPAFEEFFPDDAEGGLALDRLYADREESPLSDQEMLTIVRQGLRRTTVRPNLLFGWFSNRFIRWPQNPAAVEILYHSLDADPLAVGNDSILSNALYFGHAQKYEKPDNLLRALYEVYLEANRSEKQKILGLLKTDHDKQQVAAMMIETLDKHAQLPPTQVIAVFDAYQQLMGKTPPQPERFAEIGRFVLLFGFEQDFSPEEVVQLVRVQLHPGKKLLKIDTLTDKDDPRRHSLFALIQGSAERDRMIKAFQDLNLDGIELHAVFPLNEEWFNMATDGALPDYHDYLE